MVQQYTDHKLFEKLLHFPSCDSQVLFVFLPYCMYSTLQHFTPWTVCSQIQSQLHQWKRKQNKPGRLWISLPWSWLQWVRSGLARMHMGAKAYDVTILWSPWTCSTLHNWASCWIKQDTHTHTYSTHPSVLSVFILNSWSLKGSGVCSFCWVKQMSWHILVRSVWAT